MILQPQSISSALKYLTCAPRMQSNFSRPPPSTHTHCPPNWAISLLKAKLLICCTSPEGWFIFSSITLVPDA